ncbi:hypothetical protein ACU4GG_31285 [Streptomyces nojiriensis]
MSASGFPHEQNSTPLAAAAAARRRPLRRTARTSRISAWSLIS